MATEGIPNLFTRIASITFGIPEAEVLDGHLSLIHPLVNKAWDGRDHWVTGNKGSSYVGSFMKFAHEHLGSQYHAPTAEQADQIEGLIELWANYSSGEKGISHAGPGMVHGVYDHFKGGIYLTMGTARFASGDNEPVVEYLSMLHASKHTRLCTQWNEIVKWPDGKYRSRFVYRSPDLLTPPPSFKVPSPKLPYEVG